MRLTKSTTITMSILLVLSTPLFIGCGDNEVQNENKIEPKSKKNSDVDIQQLVSQRDEAIKVALHVNQDAEKLESKNLALKAKLENMVLKNSTAQSTINITKKVSPQNTLAIQNISRSRDEAIYVSLNLQKENKELKSKLSKLNRYNKKDIQYFESKIKETQRLVDNQNRNIKRLTKNLERANQKKEHYKKFRSQNRELQSKIKEVNRNYEIEIKELKRSTKYVQRQLENKQHTIQKLTEDLEKNSQKIQIAMAQRDEAIQTVLNISKATKQSDLKNQVNTLTQQRDEAIQTVLNINKATKELDNQIKQSFSSLNEAQKLNSELKIELAKKEQMLKFERELRKKLEANLEIKINTNSAIPETLANSLEHSNVAFQADSAILTEQSSQLLDKIVEIMKDYPNYQYNIQGHTDSSGNEEYNLNLSTKRAKSVNDYLILKGVEYSLLSFEGFGSSEPIADNQTHNGRVQNRRVIVEIKK